MIRGDVTPGQTVHGFTITRADRPTIGGKRGVWVRCPKCRREFAAMPSNLRRVVGCGCSKGLNKYPNRFPKGTEIGRFVVVSNSRRPVPYSNGLTVHVRCPFCKKHLHRLPSSLRRMRSCGCAVKQLHRLDRLVAEFGRAMVLDERYAIDIAVNANLLLNGQEPVNQGKEEAREYKERAKRAEYAARYKAKQKARNAVQ